MGTKIQLLPDEQIVPPYDKDPLILTTKRVRYNSEIVGASSFISITLDSVASCAVVTRSYPLLLVLAAVAGVGAFMQRGDLQTMLTLLGIALVIVFVYLASRRSVLSIASNGGETISVPAKGMSRTSIIEFLEAVEREKLK